MGFFEGLNKMLGGEEGSEPDDTFGEDENGKFVRAPGTNTKTYENDPSYPSDYQAQRNWERNNDYWN